MLAMPFCVFAQTNTPVPNPSGGGFEESLGEPRLAVPASEDGIWDINDSLAFIPAFDIYCKWDTRNIHAYEFDGVKMEETVEVVLREDSCDYQVVWC